MNELRVTKEEGLDRLVELADRRREVDRQITEMVCVVKVPVATWSSKHVSWGEIGLALGCSAQAAHQRYSRAVVAHWLREDQGGAQGAE